MNKSQKLLFLGSLLTLSVLTGFVIIQYKKSSAEPKQIQRFQAIIFDLDGTTINTDPLWKQAAYCTLCQYVPTLDQTIKGQLCTTCQDMGVYETVTHLLTYLKDKHNVEITMNQIFQDSMPHLTTIYKDQGIEFIPHFDQFHKNALAANLKTAIATSSQQHIIELITSIIPLQSYFAEHIYHVDHVNRVYKPEPDVYLYAAKSIGVDPKCCIAIEDSATGIKAAKAAGMYCIGINTGKNRDVLCQADEIVDCYSQIDLEKLLNMKVLNA